MSNNSFMNPIGSILETLEDDSVTKVVGAGGSVRHAAKFSPGNPFASQIESATNNKDKDALYERAIEWEADYSNLQEQRAYNRSVLEEQREYDSPEAVAARNRAAGINLDIAGSSSAGSGGSGSSSQMQIPDMADQSAQSKFSNVYDNASTVFDGLNSAANLISSLSGAASSIIQGVVSLKRLPAEINKLNAESNASSILAQSSADNVEIARQGRQDAAMEAMTNRILTLSQVLTPDSTLDDENAVFAVHGIPEEEYDKYRNALAVYRKNPEYLAKYSQSQLAQREGQATLDNFTPEFFSEMIAYTKRIQLQQARFGANMAEIQSVYSENLLNSDYAQQAASNAIDQQSLLASEIGFRKQKLERDVMAFVHQLSDLKTAYNHSLEYCNQIQKNAEKAGRGLTPEEIGILESEYNKRLMLQGLGSQNLESLYAMMDDTSYSKYMYGSTLHSDGSMKNPAQMNPQNIFSQWTFNQYLQGVCTEKDLANVAIQKGKLKLDSMRIVQGYDSMTQQAVLQVVHDAVNSVPKIF